MILMVTWFLPPLRVKSKEQRLDHSIVTADCSVSAWPHPRLRSVGLVCSQLSSQGIREAAMPGSGCLIEGGTCELSAKTKINCMKSYQARAVDEVFSTRFFSKGHNNVCLILKH